MPSTPAIPAQRHSDCSATLLAPHCWLHPAGSSPATHYTPANDNPRGCHLSLSVAPSSLTLSQSQSQTVCATCHPVYDADALLTLCVLSPLNSDALGGSFYSLYVLLAGAATSMLLLDEPSRSRSPRDRGPYLEGLAWLCTSSRRGEGYPHLSGTADTVAWMQLLRR